MLNQPHIAPLTRFVDEIRRQRQASCPNFRPEHIPYFDPLDGGINARVLFLSEAPGPRAVRSGFVSRNNPDKTAENNFVLQDEAGIVRTMTVRWNVVPWYLGDGKRIRAANHGDLIQSRPYLGSLLPILGHLRIIVLLGKKAQAAWDYADFGCSLTVYRTYHLSPLSLNTSLDRRQHVQSTFRQIADDLKRLQ